MRPILSGSYSIPATGNSFCILAQCILCELACLNSLRKSLIWASFPPGMVSLKNAAFAVFLGCSAGCAGSMHTPKQGTEVAWLQRDAEKIADSLAVIGLPLKQVP